MCGIAGYFSYGGFRPDGADALKQMTDTLRHRGPDGEGAYCADGIGLGHRRLAIIDLNSGQQPMYRQDRQLVLVFNGEIYNYVELRDELQRLGHRFATQSDSEVREFRSLMPDGSANDPSRSDGVETLHLEITISTVGFFGG